MIVVTGSVVARQDTFDEVRRLSLEHVHRSRKEPGCISHAVHVDCENALRLVFIEQWADRAALLAHFAVPASRDFVKALQPLRPSNFMTRASSKNSDLHGCVALLIPILRCSIGSTRYADHLRGHHERRLEYQIWVPARAARSADAG
jgi:quinol monooxygenase YgiN